MVLIGLAVVTVLPFLYVIAGSFAGESELASRPFFLWPHDIDLSSYRYIFSTGTFLRSLLVTIGVTIVGTLVQLALTTTMAYPLAHRRLPGRNLILSLIVFTMVFSGGMIPTFLVVRQLGLLDSYWALILPMAISPFYLVIIKNFFQELPAELQEAARIDGCTEIGVFLRIVLPLSKPILATFALFYAVAIWNDFTSPLLYLSDTDKWTLQMFVRQVTVSTDLASTVGQLDSSYVPPEQGVRFATVVVGTLPILMVYPFLQKHFAKGMLIGSVKG
ncbi:binding-protein-dependent transport systems inner membrane component [Streptomyces bingchenggensis BCW-1]|uniref:Binding-protein-dependent transport systems inner membrane component n=1 Tax=Streptomyces bingchenggensis (strain BCW-1) TaxID=749414 RepID=D7BW37_STRBB|nr:binding-protein-dependent transport systems inner membrane component [Streptomyces bingchenggensis BCW-1]